jgi:hypothetical protein
VHNVEYDGSMKLSKLKQLVKLAPFFIKLHCQLPTLYSVYGQWKIGGILTPINLKCSQNNLSQSQTIHYTTHKNIPGIKPGLPLSENHYIQRRISLYFSVLILHLT